MKWHDETRRLVELSPSDRLKWLSELLFFVTMMARGAYDSAAGAASPELKRFNEVAHRIAAQIRHRLYGREGVPDIVFAVGIAEDLQTLGLVPIRFKLGAEDG